MGNTSKTYRSIRSRPQVEKHKMATKQIPIEALSVGMYAVELDCPWPETGSLANRHRIEHPEDIAFLKAYGVLWVIIDPTLGKDVPEVAAPPEVHAGVRAVEPTNTPRAEALQELGTLERELVLARAVQTEAMTAVQSIFEGVKTGAPIDSAAVKQTVYTLLDSTLRSHDPLVSLIHIRQYDANLFAHAVNVCVFALVVGKSQGFSKLQLEHLGVGALMHDIGKLRLPRNLLRKQGVYTAPERQLVQRHPQLGLTILASAKDIHEASRRIVIEHHERLDGSGYPAGLKGLEISPLSEIVGIADMYDAMLSSREGRPPLPPAQAIKELYQYGLKGQCDRRWIERVVRCLGVYPVGSLVELNTGERGVVVAVHPTDALRPSVKIIWDADQQPYPLPLLVDLTMPHPHGPERTILRALDPHKENLQIAAYLEGSNCEPVGV
jgi:HD-GYP domain-containing protein (c-di-GMP phosphodiesterase class II)